MNKYLKGFLNTIIGLAIGFVGFLFSLNILVAGFIYFPDIVMRTDQMLIDHFGIRVVGGVVDAVMSFIVSLLPLCFILVMLAISVFVMFFTMKLKKRFDIEKIIADFNSNKAKEGGNNG